jgi:hypothetical protein
MSRPKGCPDAEGVLFPRRHGASCRLFSRKRGCLCIFEIALRQNRKASRRKIVMHIIDVRQFFLSTTIRALGGEAVECGRSAEKQRNGALVVKGFESGATGICRKCGATSGWR